MVIRALDNGASAILLQQAERAAGNLTHSRRARMVEIIQNIQKKLVYYPDIKSDQPNKSVALYKAPSEKDQEAMVAKWKQNIMAAIQKPASRFHAADFNPTELAANIASDTDFCTAWRTAATAMIADNELHVPTNDSKFVNSNLRLFAFYISADNPYFDKLVRNYIVGKTIDGTCSLEVATEQAIGYVKKAPSLVRASITEQETTAKINRIEQIAAEYKATKPSGSHISAAAPVPTV